MTKSIVAIATAILAATTLLSSAAEAGFGIRIGFGGVPPYLTDYNKQSAYEHKQARTRTYHAARRHEKAPVHVTKRSSDNDSVAKVEEKTEAAPVAEIAEMENSSISVAQVETKQETAAIETATAAPSEAQAERKLDCRKFFAAAGMTLSVPCE